MFSLPFTRELYSRASFQVPYLFNAFLELMVGKYGPGLEIAVRRDGFERRALGKKVELKLRSVLDVIVGFMVSAVKLVEMGRLQD